MVVLSSRDVSHQGDEADNRFSTPKFKKLEVFAVVSARWTS